MFVTYLYSDSRGARICHLLRDQSDQNAIFRVRYRKGANLMQIWELIESDLLTKKIDLVIVMAGVCDLTDRYINTYGHRVFWPPFDLDSRFLQIENTMKSMANNFKLLGQGNKLCFLQEPGLDLVRWNRIQHPVPWQVLIRQASLEHNLDILQRFTLNLNSWLGVPTPWTLEVTHCLRNNKWIPVYDRLFDGIHPSQQQVNKYSRAIVRYARSALHTHS